MKKLLYLPVLFVFFMLFVASSKHEYDASDSELLVGLWTKHYEDHTPWANGDTLFTMDDTVLFRKDGTGLWKVRNRLSGKWYEKGDLECRWRIDSNLIFLQFGDTTSSEMAVRIGLLTADTLKFAYLKEDTTYKGNTFWKIK